MRLVAALALVAALVLSGCASNEPTADAADAADLPGAGAGQVTVVQEHRLRFASGDYEGILTGEATWGPTEVCMPQCQPGALKAFDLTPIIPADAPVELAITIDGNAFGSVQYTDAGALHSGDDDEEGGNGGNGNGQGISALVVRSASGTVTLTLRSFGFPPDPNGASASWEARTVVRADLLVPYMPATVTLKDGEQVNVTGSEVEEVILVAPNGRMQRVQSAPFVVAANGTSGDHTLIMVGDDTGQVFGPNTTLRAKRIAQTMGEPHPLTAGSEATWTFQAEGIPVHMGLAITNVDNAGFFGVGTTVQSYALKLTSPANVVVLDESGECTGGGGGGGCGFSLIGGMQMGFGTGFLDEYLVPGTYSASVTAQGNNLQAFEYVLTVV